MSDKKQLRVAYVGSPELFLRGASPIHIMKMCQAMAKLGIDVELILLLDTLFMVLIVHFIHGLKEGTMI